MQQCHIQMLAHVLEPGVSNWQFMSQWCHVCHTVNEHIMYLLKKVLAIVTHGLIYVNEWDHWQLDDGIDKAQQY